jgi:hypothetical protein
VLQLCALFLRRADSSIARTALASLTRRHA